MRYYHTKIANLILKNKIELSKEEYRILNEYLDELDYKDKVDLTNPDVQRGKKLYDSLIEIWGN